MIKIMKYGEVPNSEIFARSVPKTDVAIYHERGTAHKGIAGKDILLETERDI